MSIGYVPGLQQTPDSADLMAIVSALEWRPQHQVSKHFWIDSKFVADGLLYLLTYGATGSWDHLDLWHRAEQLLQQLGQHELIPRWIPI